MNEESQEEKVDSLLSGKGTREEEEELWRSVTGSVCMLGAGLSKQSTA